MDRALRLTSLWSYLPTFRVVAELEHLTKAAKRLGVSPSAVSRTIALIEADLGQPLFERVGRRLALNAAGQHLLVGTRRAMRTLDESLSALQGRTMMGRVRIGLGTPVYQSMLAKALAGLALKHPALICEVSRVLDGDAPSLLLRGSLDLALVGHTEARASLTIDQLAKQPTAVFAERSHPVFAERGRGSNSSALSRHRFVEVAAKPRAPRPWPVEIQRTVGLTVHDYDLALQAALHQALVAVLPIALAEPYVEAGQLVRLAQPKTLPLSVYLIGREELESGGGIDLVRAALRGEAS